ncbi:MAG: hypothetical protein Kow00109_10920 [Acidobacteriota bacterium]
MAETTPGITLVVINFNGARFLPELFAGLAAQTRRDFRITVYDNASSDGSPELARRLRPAAEVHELGENAGFARAVNLGVRRAATPYVGILNADVRPEPTWLEELAATLDRHADVAAAAPKMLLAERPGILNGVGGAMNRLGYTWDRGMGEEDRGQYDEPAEVLFAPAAAALFRREAFLGSGGFDARFFMYHEDVDLGWRLWLLGHRILTAPAAVVYHHFGGSTRGEKGMSWREIIGERNNIRSLLKNYEAANLGRVLLRLLLLRQPPRRKLAQVRNFLWNLAFLPETLRLRRSIQRRRVRRDADLAHLIEARDDVPVTL